MRYARRRDDNEMDMFTALKVAGCNPVRCTDFDIGAEHVDGYGLMIEVKMPKGRLQPLQEKLRAASSQERPRNSPSLAVMYLAFRPEMPRCATVSL